MGSSSRPGRSRRLFGRLTATVAPPVRVVERRITPPRHALGYAPPMVQCPRCRQPWQVGHPCGVEERDGIPDLYVPAPEAGEDVAVTERVRLFYEERPFPDYRDTDDLGALVRKGRANGFTRDLDDAIPPRATVVEVGCGTGQMSLFLAVAGRSVVGVDLTWASLGLAESFRRKAGIPSAQFVRANVFRLPFADASVDVVISNGVLHHTANPRAGFAELARIVRPGGYVLVGLYNRYGRALLPLLASAHRKGTSAREKAWYNDQHLHPQESRHTADEVLGWLAEEGLTFVSASPPLELGAAPGPLFSPSSSGTPLGRFFAQLSWLPRAGDGGLWVTVAQKPLA